MNLAAWLASAVGAVPESSLHAHCPEERAELFSAVEPGAAELETLNLLNALALSSKPALVLETGTGSGLTTLALAIALAQNGTGHLHTVELDPGVSVSARERLERLVPGVSRWVTFHVGDSRELCGSWAGLPFDFAFFDSLVSFRHLEYRALLRRGALAPGALCAFHDTSRLRGRTMPDFCPEMVAALDEESAGSEWLEMPLSRGLRLLRVPREVAA